jgi:subtilisin family serine protease
MLAMFAAAVRPKVADDPNAGVSLVELYRDQDTHALEAELRRDPTVESVSRVPIRYLVAKKKKASPKKSSPAVAAPSASSLWNLAKIRWAEARQKTGFKDATNIKVAVLDTGIDIGHPDMPTIANYEFAHPTNANASSNRDIIGHGTHVSGTIAARINNSVGINGICNCKLSMFKIFDDTPDWHPQAGYFAYFVDPVMYQRALSRCLTLKMNVINLSIGGGGAPSPNEQLLFSKLIQAGTSVVAAMGDENSSRPSYPAAIPGVIAVGATSINDMRASFSNFGGHITLVAPGAGIWSTLPTYAGNMGYRSRPTSPPQPDFTRPLPRDRDYASWDGTSMASPHVAAAVALLLAKSSTLMPTVVKKKLQTTAVKVAGMQGQNFTQEYGYGRLDLVKLLA